LSVDDVTSIDRVVLISAPSRRESEEESVVGIETVEEVLSGVREHA
jgi:hypothetical protein